MLINSLTNVGAAPRSSNVVQSFDDASFASALDGAQMRLTQSADTPTRTLSTSSANDVPTRAYRSEAAREFAEYADKSVAERVRDAILKDMGLTEDDLKAMDPEKRAAIEDEIARRIKAILAGEYDSDRAQTQDKRVDALMNELASSLALD